jgi:hypothetical protein
VNVESSSRRQVEVKSAEKPLGQPVEAARGSHLPENSPRVEVEDLTETEDVLAGRMSEARTKFFHSMIVDSDRRSSSSSAHRTGTSVLPALGKIIVYSLYRTGNSLLQSTIFGLYMTGTSFIQALGKISV